MKHILLLSSLIFWASCSNTVVVDNEVDPVKQSIDLGFYALTPLGKRYTPYDNLRTLVFQDATGQAYTFQLTQPIYNDFYRFFQLFPHPTVGNQQVEYTYVGERFNYDWICADLGAKLSVVVRPAICTDPQLRTEDVLLDHLTVAGIGFNNGDVALSAPALDVNIRDRMVCTAGGRYLGTVTLLDREFTEVSYARQYLDNRFLEIYYSPSKGIVAFGTRYLFAVLDRSF
ncbi:MAG: hypothetical protein DA408_16910 [Bacteroidetes bacterium]|nr:MAG: hypothetical protein C7N36_19180 [Bacteroidota bacterium]PTM10048.1 MAG: hypothetical protein DA408_16910 [Bacteroidota bacterium]